MAYFNLLCTVLIAAIMIMAAEARAQSPVPFTGPDGKVGLKDAAGSVLVEPKYNDIFRFIDGFAIVTYSHGTTFINRKGEEVIPVRYKSISAFSKGTARAERQVDAKGPFLDFLIDTTGKELNSEGSSFPILFYEDVARLKLEYGWSYINRQGTKINRNLYDDAYNFQEGVAVVKHAGKFGMINKQGNVIVPLEYPVLRPMSNGLALFCEINAFGDSLYGYLNKAGEVVIKPQYSAATSFAPNGLAGACKAGLNCGYIDKQGYIAIKFQYKSVGPFKGEKAEVTKGSSKIFIDRTGTEVKVPPKFQIKENVFKEGLAVTENLETGKFGYKDKQGKIVIDHLYEEAYGFNNGLAAVKNDGRFGAVNKRGELIIPLKFESISILKHGLIPVKENGKWYHYNASGNLYTMEGYDLAGALSDGMGLVCKENRCGYIDSTGTEVIPRQYTRAGAFSQGLAHVFVGTKLKYGYIDRHNNIVLAPKYDSATPFTSEGKAKVSIGKNEFWIDKSGKKLKG